MIKLTISLTAKQLNALCTTSVLPLSEAVL